MKQILSDYLKICAEYAASNEKDRKKIRHAKLCEWAERVYSDLPEADEVIGFISDHQDICYAKQFIVGIILPCLKKEYKECGTVLFSFLLATRNNISLCDNCMRLFCETENIDSFQLTDILIARQPANEYFLSFRLDVLNYFLQYSVHELPLGLLCDDEDTVDAELSYKIINEWAELSKKFGMDVASLKEKYLELYRAWYDYLSIREKGDFDGNFESYLNLKEINWEDVFKA